MYRLVVVIVSRYFHDCAESDVNNIHSFTFDILLFW